MIDVLIADDHALIRQGLVQILAETDDIRVVAQAENGHGVLQLLERKCPDVLVLDLSMPGLGGIDTLKQVRRQNRSLPVLILSVNAEDQYALRMLKAGADGYLCKDRAPEELITAIRQVAGGNKYVPTAVVNKMFRVLDGDPTVQLHEKLSDREFQVLCAIAQGRTLSEIADAMFLSVKTISTYRSRLLEKMDMRSNAELTTYAVREGLV